MGKQKFSCKGVLRSTGQRVAVTVSADNREAAIQLANQHGVTVESVMPVAEPAPQPPKIVEQKPAEKKVAGKKLDARIDDILDAEDEDLPGGLDDLDLGDEGSGETSPGSPTTKACPYCGEQILAVAVKCKHCGSCVGAKAANRHESDNDSPPTKTDAHGVVSLISGVMAFFIFVVGCLLFNLFAWVTYPLTFVFAVAGFVEGLLARGNLRVAGIFLNLLAAIPGVAALAVVLIGLIINRAAERIPTVSPQPEPPVAARPAPPPPKPEVYKPSAEEMAFAVKLTAFLDGCDELAKLLEKGPKMDQFNKQCEATKARFAAIAPVPQGVSWAGDAVAASKRMIEMLDVTTMELTTLDAAMEALHQTLNNSPEAREACRKAAEELRKPLGDIRKMIPPGCLAKPK